ncbi:MAG: alkaline phosphatase family protein [Myxococcota bacterium]|nr:alkaline phosphatase family protein [Myxococcota bacterium]
MLLASVYLAALWSENPSVQDLPDALVLGLFLWAYHAVLVGGFTLPLLGWSHVRGHRPPSPFASLSFVALVVVGLASINAILRFTLSYAMLRGELGFASPLGVVSFAVFAGSIPIAMWLLYRPRPFALRIGVLAALALAWAGVVAGSLDAERPPPPPVDNLAIENPAAPPASWSGSIPDGAPARVVLLGVDGLSWHVLAPLFAAGELPHLAMLARDGARAPLASVLPTSSPSLWSTIATGRDGAAHGIHGFSLFRLPGMHGAIGSGPIVGSSNWWNGLNRVLSAAGSLGWIEQPSFARTDRRVAALWDVAARHGVSTGVVKWYATWPVLERGDRHFMVSDFSGRPGSVAVSRRAFAILEREREPGPDFEDGSPFRSDPWLARYARNQNDWMGRALDLDRLLRPRLGLYYAHFTDAVQHLYWRGDARADWLYAPDPDHYLRFAPQVTDAYGLVDRWLGTLLEDLAPNTTVLVVSDHGFAFDGHEHHRGPEGVLLMAGPGVRRGSLATEASIFDIAPTVSRLLELPISDELPGRVLDELLDPGLVPPARRVAAWDWFTPDESSAARSPEIERDILDRMKELGYVN